MSNSPFIINATQENFTELLALSSQKPVLVDFWASWCAPCRQLKPLLEKLAVEYAGGFVLALVNSDEQPALAQQQYGVRSLPTLMLFKDGVVIQTEMGAQPEAKIRAMLDPHIAPRASESLRSQAKHALNEGRADDAIALLTQAASEEPENYKIHLDLVGVFITQGRLTDANQLFNALGKEAKESKEGKPIAELLSFAVITADAPSPSELAAQLKADASNHLALYQLAAYAVLDRQFNDSMEMYLQIIRVDKNFADGAAKQALLKLFDMINLSQPDLVRAGRRKLQMLLF